MLARLACWLLGKLAPEPHPDLGDVDDVFPPRLETT